MQAEQKLTKLRALMTKNEVEGYLVPRTDEYQGEYVAACAERLAWLTGFTGSAGMSIVMMDKAVAMSDGRYTIQLEQQVEGDHFERVNSQETSPDEWLKQNAANKVIGYDPKLHTPAEIKAKEKAGLKLKAIDQNLIDMVWENRPDAPRTKIFLFDEKIAGISAVEKIKNLQMTLKEENADAVILTMSDSIAWLLNIRGNDIPFIPVALSYAIVPQLGNVQWFIHADKITNDVRDALAGIVDFKAEEALELALDDLKDSKVWLDPKRSSIWFKNKLGTVIEKDDPCIMPRACKNQAEQNAMRVAHIRDGVALVKFLKWFDAHDVGENELSVEERLEAFRAVAPEFKEPSFSTIAGFGGNGAIVHYRANESSSKTIEEGNLLLLDSGAQYSDGTTDITRTIAVGTPSAEMIACNTLVLKGHIGLAMAVFDKDTLAKDIDMLARTPLQEKGLDYAHGTGHGVGCFLSVHEEAAKGISPRSDAPLKAGMIISNEPGFYKEGEYGIRIENLVLVCEDESEKLFFDTITFAPIDKNLIDVKILNDAEKKWLNAYHQKVFKTLSPLLDSNHVDWLKQATEKI